MNNSNNKTPNMKYIISLAAMFFIFVAMTSRPADNGPSRYTRLHSVLIELDSLGDEFNNKFVTCVDECLMKLNILEKKTDAQGGQTLNYRISNSCKHSVENE